MNEERLTEQECEALVRLVKRATGVPMRLPPRNDESAWIAELHATVVGAYNKLDSAYSNRPRPPIGPDWRRVQK